MMIERYRTWYEHECDSNDKMLSMIESVPAEKQSNPKFQRALVLAAHLAACRDNWLDRMINIGQDQVDWWPEQVAKAELRPRYQRTQEAWISYFARLTDDDLAANFEFQLSDESRYRWGVEGQIVQLVGHAFYHRGQIAQIVAELGGHAVDTDYLYWAIPLNSSFGKIEPS